MTEQILFALAMLLAVFVFVEVILPRQTRAFYENVVGRRLESVSNSLTLREIALKIPAYAVVAYLSFETEGQNEISSVLLAALVCSMAAATTYFKSFKSIIADIRAARR